MDFSQRLEHIHALLKKTWSTDEWWPNEAGPFETCLGAILTQNTSWLNAEKALCSMKKEGLVSIEKVREIPINELATIIRSSGYYNAKAKKIKSFVDYVYANYNGIICDILKQPITKLRNALLEIYGIGNETADDIILFASNKPSFVVDAYTLRIFSRIGILQKNVDYSTAQQFFHKNLDNNTLLFQEYHALVVILAQNNCHKSLPECITCPIQNECEWGRKEVIY